jgi:Fe-S cluster biogenesis protein NfuA
MESDTTQSGDLLQRVEEALDTIRPMLQMDGGDVELVGIDQGVVRLRLVGACGGCPMSALTLKTGIERTLKQAIPEVDSVEAE